MLYGVQSIDQESLNRIEYQDKARRRISFQAETRVKVIVLPGRGQRAGEFQIGCKNSLRAE